MNHQEPIEEVPVGLVAGLAQAMDSIALRRDEQHQQGCCNWRPKNPEPRENGEASEVPTILAEKKVPADILVEIAMRLETSTDPVDESMVRDLADEYGYPYETVQAGLADLKGRLRRRNLKAASWFPPLN